MGSRSLLVALCLLAACDQPASTSPLPDNPGRLPDAEIPPGSAERGQVVHAMQPFALEGSEETMSCYSWTLDNDAPLYVNAVTFQNEGAFHHSNWFVVPEDVYAGDDGFWPCAEREFNDISAALSGTVVFAQSTQAQRETMGFTEGAVIRIPARSKIVAGIHLLNMGPDPRETAGWMTLEAIHPGLVETILSPMMFTYRDLEIPPLSTIEFVGGCAGVRGLAPLELHYALPHYHRAGIEARLSFFEGEEETIAIDQQGFGATPMGRTFDPPLELEDLTGVEFACTYQNPHDETLTWGIGINEMCVFLAFASTSEVAVAGVEESFEEEVELEDGTLARSGDCETLTIPRGRAYDRPTRQEIEAPLRLPPSDDDAPEPPSCSDTPGTYEADTPPSFSEVQSRVLEPWCSFSSCHGSGVAAGLDVRGEQAYDALVDVPSTVGSLPRVVPSDPEGSALYRLVSECEPELDGVAVRHMPAGAPTLLEPELVGLVRAWIEAGAPR